MIIAVSDVHLAEHPNDPVTKKDDANFLDFLRYINKNQLKEGDDLVILGDLVDFWRRDFVKALIESSEILTELGKLKKNVKIHYIIGNHDYYVWNLKDLLKDRFPFSSVSKHETISDGGRNFFFMHGYQLEVLANPYYKSLSTYETFSEHLCLGGDDSGNAASTVWDLYQASKSWLDGLKKLPVSIEGALNSMMVPPEKRLSGNHRAGSFIDGLASSAARSMYLGTQEDDTFVFGHTHEPFQDDANRVVNAGSWNKSPCGCYSFLEISNGQPKLMEFDKGSSREQKL